MPPAPGQRAGQLPQHAATASQRALARAAAGDAGTSAEAVINLPSGRWRVAYDEAGRQWWTNTTTGARCEGAPCDNTTEGEG